MLELTLDVDDVAATRFAISPAIEVATSLQRLRRPGLHAPSRPWETGLARRLHGFDIGRLALLVSPTRWLPDFITPFPERSYQSFCDQLSVIAATDPVTVELDLRAAHPAGLPESIRRRIADPAALRDEICEVLAAYWTAAIEPSWARIVATLEADIAARQQQLGGEGLGRMFAGLDERVTWEGGVLRLDVAQRGSYRVAVAGRRLPLVPSVFARWPTTNLSTDLAPYIAYPARGAAATWAAPASAGPNDYLTALLGRGRTAVLRALDAPACTTDLATRLGLTPSTVSEHLSVLARSTLVIGARRGRRVLYRRTPLGEEVMAASLPAGE